MVKEDEVVVTKKVDLHQLHLVTHQKIDLAEQKKSITEREVYLIAKEFFKDLLELNYEFTHDELIDELRKTYLDKESFDKLENFILLMGQIEYSKRKFSQEELKVMLKEMRGLVDHLIQHHQKKMSFFDKIILSINPKHKKTLDYETSSLKQLEEKIDTEEEIVDEKLIESLRKLITDAEKQQDKQKAKAIYEEVKKTYDLLNNTEKKHIYSELVHAAELIKQMPETSSFSKGKNEEKSNEFEKDEEDNKSGETLQDKEKNLVKKEPSKKKEKKIEQKEKDVLDKTKEITNKNSTEKKEKASKENVPSNIAKKSKEEKEEIASSLIKEPLFEEPEEEIKEEPTTSKKDMNMWTADHDEQFPEITKDSPFTKEDEIVPEEVKEENDEKEDIMQLIPDLPEEESEKETIILKPKAIKEEKQENKKKGKSKQRKS